MKHTATKPLSFRTLRSATLAAVAAMGLSMTPTVSLADQGIAFGAGNSASANLDFIIRIPSFLVFRLGSAGAGNIDLIDFDLVTGAVQPGNGTPVAATAASGDQGNGRVTVGILTNVTGNLSTTVTANAAGLSDGGAGSIPFTDITTNDAGATLNAPTLTNGVSAPVVTAVSGVTNTLAAGEFWEYQYANTTAYAAGTYGGVNVNNGRVTYAVALP